MMRAERETLKAEVARAPQELARKEKVDKEVEQPVAETENLKAGEEAENVEAEAKITVQERGVMGIDTLPVVQSAPLTKREKRNAAKRQQLARGTLQGTSSEQLMADLARFGDSARRTMQDIEALQVELEILRSEKLKAEADARTAVADAQRAEADSRTAVAETEILISIVKKVAKGVGRSMTKNEQVKADSERINKDLENLIHEMQGLTDEVGRVRSERARIKAGGERLRENIVADCIPTAFYRWDQEQDMGEW